METRENLARFDTLFRQCPLVAILRGVEPAEVLQIAQGLLRSGIRLIEVPLNSPRPMDSIRLLVKALGAEAMIGAGTVTSVAQVLELADLGGTLVVSPNFDEEVVQQTVRSGLVSLPGVATPSEAFRAVRVGAHAIKAFPAEQIGVAGLKAWHSVLPKGIRVLAVGGVDVTTIPTLRAAGVVGFGVGSSLYRPGQSAADVELRAKKLVAACAAIND